MQHKIPTLPFEWNLFVDGVAGDYIPSCVAMAARYWKSINPSLQIPDDPQAWNEFVKRTSNVSYRGTSLKRLMVNMPSTTEVNNQSQDFRELDVELSSDVTPTLEVVETHDLILDPRMLSKSEELIDFLADVNPIPVILVLDVGLADRNKKWGQHATLLHSVNLYERKIYVIDPMLGSLKEPRPMDLRRFEIGWKECYNTAILIYPKNSNVNIKSSKQRNLRLTDFLGENTDEKY